MTKVAKMESELEKLSQAELRQVRQWLDDVIADDLESRPKLHSAIHQSEPEMGKGARPRPRRL